VLKSAALNPMTHQLEADLSNQPPPLSDYNLYAGDRALKQAAEREGAAWADDELGRFGALLGRSETLALGELANRHAPMLNAFDRFGRRLDEVEFHPAWHRMLEIGVAQGLHAGPWAEPRQGAHVARAAGVILMTQVEAGCQCPMTMTYGAVPALKREPQIAQVWLPRVYSRRYDRRFLPADAKTGALIGMGMTEKTGGSDVRSNQTRARPLGPAGPGREYVLNGHKWFLSAPMCDAFLLLAQTERGLGCFFTPRFLPDGTSNGLFLLRLKDKLGNRSNASAEVEFVDAHGWLINEEGRGIPTILEMGNYTRLDCVLGTTGLMRQALAQACFYAAHRRAFLKRLVDQPIMRNVLADLALEAEAACVLALRLARAYDLQEDAFETSLRRLLTPAAKFWICKQGPMLAAEALEVLGGNGYTEDWILARLYREMPVNSIWEGSGNVMCLDVLRAAREPDAVQALLAEVEQAAGADAALDLLVAELKDDLAVIDAAEGEARGVVEKLVVAVQAALLLRHAPAFIADAFCASRLKGHRSVYGTLGPGADCEAIVARAMPV
jgi:putative acyl-CoA dehydrogenase